jgi:Na+/H+ antiporter NhaB
VFGGRTQEGGGEDRQQRPVALPVFILLLVLVLIVARRLCYGLGIALARVVGAIMAAAVPVQRRKQRCGFRCRGFLRREE